MKSLRNVELSRRALVSGVGITTTTLWGLSPRVASAAETLDIEAAVSTFAPAAMSLTTAKYYSDDWGTESTAALPTRVAFDPRTGPLQFSMTWDSRLFSVRQPAYCVGGNETEQVQYDVSGDGRASLEVPEGTSELVFRIETIDLYPNDNLSDVKQSAIALQDLDELRTESWADELQRVECSPWGVEASVSWICYRGAIVPALTSVVSVGPSDAPAGSTIKLNHADVVNAPQLVQPLDKTFEPGRDAAATKARPDVLEDSSATSIESTSSSGIREVIITLSEPLAAGDRLDFANAVEVSDSEPTAYSTFVPRMAVLPAESTAGMRMTGKLASIPLTGAGMQESIYLAAPTA
ncbi:hypothetical protein [Rathayibacter iranicus]|nr:hypothetical protein [Rathayibacter iranicus]